MCCSVSDLISAQLSKSDFESSTAGTKESSYLGLRDIKLACDMSASITRASLRVEVSAVVFELDVSVEMLEMEQKWTSTPAHPPPAHPPPTQRCVPPSIPAIPESTSDCSNSVTATLETAQTTHAHLPTGLTYVHADDDMMPRLFMEDMIAMLEGDSSSLVLGEKYEDLLNLPPKVALLADSRGHDQVIVMLDECLELRGYPPLRGTNLCKELRDVHGFKGVIVIVSANDEVSAFENAKQCGADALAPKGVNLSVRMLSSLLASLLKKKFTPVEQSSLQSHLDDQRVVQGIA